MSGVDGRAESDPRVTQLLQELNVGNERAADGLLELVYEELRRLAAARLAHESAGRTIQATALVHEAYLASDGNR